MWERRSHAFPPHYSTGYNSSKIIGHFSKLAKYGLLNLQGTWGGGTHVMGGGGGRGLCTNTAYDPIKPRYGSLLTEPESIADSTFDVESIEKIPTMLNWIFANYLPTN